MNRLERTTHRTYYPHIPYRGGVERMVLGAISSFHLGSVSPHPASMASFAYSPAVLPNVDIVRSKFVTFVAMRLPCVPR